MDTRPLFKRFGAFCALTALLSASAFGIGLADVPTLTSGPQSSTATTGSAITLPLNGQSTCSIVASDTGTATLTVQGSADGATFATNTNFGTAGVISVVAAPQTVGGNVAAYPKAFTAVWTSNTGTLTYTETCSAAGGLSGGGSAGTITGNVTVVQPTAGSLNATVTQSATSAGSATANPAYTRIQDGAGTTLGTVQASGADALTNAIAGIISHGLNYGFNGTTWDRLKTVTGQNAAFTNKNLAVGLCDPIAVTSASCATVNAAGTVGANAVNTNSYCLAGVQGVGGVQCLADYSSNYGHSILDVAPGGAIYTRLTAGSATACTAIETAPNYGRLVKIINAGATQTVFLTVYDEGASPTCAAADIIYGDGTVALTAGQVVTLDIPVVSGLAYKLSGAITGTIIITRT